MRFCIENINLMLFLPLIVCFLLAANGLTLNRMDKQFIFNTSIISSLICLFFGGCAFILLLHGNVSVESSFLWLSSDNVNFYLGTLIDKVSVVFLFLSALAFFIVQLFAYLKMCDSINYGRLVFYLNLFAFGLFGIFLAPNILQAYILCEVVGVASYLLINFDFSNREESRAAIKSFIFNRIGDLTLLFCVLTILYFSITYNQLFDSSSLAFSNMTVISESINSLMSEPLFTAFCSVLIFVILMKFMQAFIYLTFESKLNTPLSKIILFQNSLIVLIGVYLFIRFNVFFVNLGSNWVWAVFIVAFLFVMIGFLNKIFMPLCRAVAWFEKYIVDSVLNIFELLIRATSYMCCRFQAGTFQTYLIYSFIGLILILAFVLIFYLTLVKI